MTTSSMHFSPGLDGDEVAEVLRAWRAAYPRLGVLALLPEAERRAIAGLQGICAAQQVPLVGAVFPAVVVNDRFRAKGGWLLRLDELAYAAIHLDLPREVERLPAAADALAASVAPHLPARDATLLLLFDATVPTIASFLDQLYLLLGNRVHYMGANAGSESFRPIPCLFDEVQTVGGGVLAVVLHPHRGAVLEHGYAVPKKMITASSTEGNRIISIDWRPAFEVYREVAREQYGVEIDRENFYRYAVRFPFGIVRVNGITLVRIPVALEQDGSLFCVGEVPPNSILTLLRAPAVDSPLTIDTLCGRLAERAAAGRGAELMLFYCAGRRLYLGVDAAEREVRDLERRSGAACIAGGLSLGEIGSAHSWAYPLFHNAALLAAAWGGA